MMIKKFLLALCCQLLLLFNTFAKEHPHTLSATRYGVKGDGKTLNTRAFNRAVAQTPAGDTLLIPAGRYLTGTIHLKSHITLILQAGAELIATTDLYDYDNYHPTKDMRRYDTGAGTRNANLTGDERWTKALIIGQNIENVTITGEGTIIGRHVTDSLGEESMRGPHTILLAESRNIRLEGIRIRQASNYAILGYELTDVVFRNLDIEEGWDGIHIRGGQNLLIADCHIKTGDDAIAGGYWENMTIRSCQLNSSCNGIRMIEPSTNLLITDCRIYGPGMFAHRSSMQEGERRAIYAIVLEPGAWGTAPGHTENVVIRNVTVDRMLSAVVYSMGEGNTCSGLTIDGLRATHVSHNTTPLNYQGGTAMWDNIDIRNMIITKDQE